MLRVLLSTRLFTEGFEKLNKDFEVVFPSSPFFSKQEILGLIGDFDAFIPTFQFKVDKEIIDAGVGRLKIIANYGVGYNNIDVDYATQKGIVVTNTPDPVIESTAELAFTLMLTVTRRLAELDRKLRLPDGLPWGVMENMGYTLYGKTLGIIGMGRIGQAVARRAVAFGMQIVYHNRNRLPLEIEHLYNARLLKKNELLKISDVISIHTPLLPETHHLIGIDEFRMMKATAILVNTSRGPVVDEEVLIRVLQSNEIFGAGLDVYEFEPQLNPKFFLLDNVVLAPHIGTATVESRIQMNQFVSQNIVRFFKGRVDITRVN